MPGPEDEEAARCLMTLPQEESSGANYVVTGERTTSNRPGREIAGAGTGPAGLDAWLVRRLASDHPGTRYKAVKELAGRDGPEVTAALVDRLAHDDHPGVRSLVVEVLDGRDAPEVTAALANCSVFDDHGGVRYSAKESLAGRRLLADSEREDAIELLSEGFAAGGLTVGELRLRAGSVLAARTVRELKEIMADLPASLASEWRRGAARATARAEGRGVRTTLEGVSSQAGFPVTSPLARGTSESPGGRRPRRIPPPATRRPLQQ